MMNFSTPMPRTRGFHLRFRRLPLKHRIHHQRRPAQGSLAGEPPKCGSAIRALDASFEFFCTTLRYMLCRWVSCAPRSTHAAFSPSLRRGRGAEDWRREGRGRRAAPCRTLPTPPLVCACSVFNRTRSFCFGLLAFFVPRKFARRGDAPSPAQGRAAS